MYVYKMINVRKSPHIHWLSWNCWSVPLAVLFTYVVFQTCLLAYEYVYLCMCRNEFSPHNHIAISFLCFLCNVATIALLAVGVLALNPFCFCIWLNYYKTEESLFYYFCALILRGYFASWLRLLHFLSFFSFWVAYTHIISFVGCQVVVGNICVSCWQSALLVFY